MRRIFNVGLNRAGACMAALCSLLLAAATTESVSHEAPVAAAGTPARSHHVENAALYARWGLDAAHLPYPKHDAARTDVQAAMARARTSGKFVMVSFGANWCADCRALHRSLGAAATRRFVAQTFEIVNVDVGDFDRNTGLAAELGVDLQMGIPVAVFYAPDGSVIGNTNRGELEPARTYTSRQILAFLRDVARNRRIAPLRARH